MDGKRDYPPAVRVHGIDCLEIKGLLLSRLPAAEIVRQYPNGEPHHACLSPRDKVGVIEAVEYPGHAYEESSVFPPDATKPLCAYCKGTHGVLDRLILPPGVARDLGSTNFR
jgi:hypothetical protein